MPSLTRKVCSWWHRWHFVLVVLTLCLTVSGLTACGRSPVDSPVAATQVLREQIIPKIAIENALISDQVAGRYTVAPIPEPLPRLEDFPLYAGQSTDDPETLFIDILTSSEKANASKQNERWLIDVADAFNQQSLKTTTGKLIQVGIRQVPSGTAARILIAKAARAAGFSPSNDLWVELIKSAGIPVVPVVSRLVPNVAGFVVQEAVYQSLAATGPVTFDRFLDQVVSGKIKVGYPNPYTSSTSLNLLYTLFWSAAGKSPQPLSVTELATPEVNSVFRAFQKQVVITTVTTLDLQELFIRDPDQLQAFPLEYQNYLKLKTLPGFEKVAFVPFGIPHNNPLVGFSWNTPEEQEALKRFGSFATATAMQNLATQQGFELTEYFQRPGLPPIPNGALLTAAQSYWKERKDGGQTVYLMLVIDTSGSMEGERLNAVKEGLRIASQQINPVNQVGMATFSGTTRRVLSLAPFDQRQHQRFLAAIDTLIPDGGTAMYDGIMVGLQDLMEQRARDPKGRYYLLVLSDGETNQGLTFNDVQDIMAFSQIRIYPIAYGEVNQTEMQAIAALREATVQAGTPKNVQTLLKDLFQTNL